MSRRGRAVWTNWGRNLRAVPASVERPGSAEEVAAIVSAVARAGQRVKTVGSGHSFSAIAAAQDIQLSVDRLHGLVAVDVERRLVTVAAGTRLRDMPALLEPHGLAMENLGDIDAQSIAGAISTGTHGSGAAFGGLAAQVAALTLVTADGAALRIDGDRDPDLLNATAVGLGALGVIVEVTLRCVPAFPVAAQERNEPLDAVIGGLVGRARMADHLDVYWFPHTDRALVKTNTRMRPGTPPHPPTPLRRWVDDELLGNVAYAALCGLGRAAPELVPSINRLASGGVAQRSYSDASHRVFTSDRRVRFVEQEYAMPAEVLPEAFTQVRNMIERRGWRISFPLEMRFSAADDLWMSTAHGRPTGYLAVHRYFREPFAEYFAAVEEICVALGGRPHWGKWHTQTADSLRPLYPRFDEFVTLRDRLDPGRVFSNDYLGRVLGA